MIRKILLAIWIFICSIGACDTSKYDFSKESLLDWMEENNLHIYSWIDFQEYLEK